MLDSLPKTPKIWHYTVCGDNGEEGRVADGFWPGHVTRVNQAARQSCSAVREYEA